MTSSPRSTDKPYDLAVFVGRFQIFHAGHLSVIENALKNAERVLILVGSANRSRDTRNPFTATERMSVIWTALADLDVERVSLQPLDDYPYDKTAWMTAVQVAARSATTAVRPRVCLTGNVRDATSVYLSWFPEWDFLGSKDTAIEATNLRKAYFDGGVNFEQRGWQDGGVDWEVVVPAATIEFLHKFRDKPEYTRLMGEKAKEDAYRERWGAGPFQTVDPVIVKGGYVLMVERGDAGEGGGMVALPGGFLNAGETLLDGCVREAVEETRIFVPPSYHSPHTEPEQAEEAARQTLLSYQRGGGVRFDDPNRDRRGHMITESFLFVLPDGHGLPSIRGADDAKRAFWMPISEVRGDNTWADHAFIIDKMLSKYL